MPDQSKDKQQESQPSLLWRFLARTWSVVGSWFKWIIIFLILFFILLQTSVVQNWLAQETTKFLSKEWDTNVSVDSLRVKFFDSVELYGFYVEDHKGDTLIYSKTLTANTNLLSLIQNSLEVEELRLENAYVAIKREVNEPNQNIQFIIDYFSSNKKKNKRPFYLNAKAIYLRNVHFYKNDAVLGQKIDAFIDKADITFNNWDLPGKRIEVDKIILDNPDVLIDEYQDTPLPELPPLPEFIDTLVQIDTVQFVLTIDDVDINNGHLDFSNFRRVPVRTIPLESIDLNHLDVYSLDADIRNFTYSDWVFTGALDSLSLTEASGFELDKLSIHDGKITPKRADLNGVSLITDQSNLGDTVIFKYTTFRDFRDFNNKILMDIRLSKDSYVLTDDIMAFAHKLESNTFFRKNRDKVLKVAGRFRGKLNNLKADDLDIRIGNGTIIKGEFSSRNLMVRQEELMNFQLDQFKTSMQTLRELMPTMKLPPNFDKLGTLNFSGRFDGFFTDFVAYGALQTELGNAEMDMRMDLKKGKELASYTGSLSLQEFDLATWAGNPNFGKVTFNSQVKNGVGLTAETAYAELEATIDQFPFKGYTYENAEINGKLNKNLFDGKFNIKDDNIDFAFNGALDFTDSIPELDFKASVNRLALKPLNLAKADLVLAGDIDLQLQNLDLTDMEGQAKVQHFKLVKDKKDSYEIDSLFTSINFDKYHERTFIVESNIIKSEVKGTFNIETIPEVLLQFAEKNYPEYANRLNINSKNDSLQTHQFDYNIEILDTKGWNFLINPGLDTLHNVLINGKFDGFENKLDLEVEIPNLQFNKINLRDAALVVNADNSDATIGFAVDSTVINKKTNLKPIVLLGLVERDTIDFGITYSDDNSFVANLDLNGKFFLTQDSLFQISFESNTLSNLVIGGQEWKIDKNNYLRFGKDIVDTKNFELLGNDKRIFAESFGDKGLRISMNDFDIHFIDSLWIYEPLDFYGLFDVEINIEDLYRLQGINALMTMDSLLVNRDNYGQVSIIANAESLKHQVDAKIKIDYWGQTLIAEGFYNPPTFQAQRANRGRPEKEPNYLDFKLDVQRYPVHFLDYFIGHSISNTRGNFDIDARLYGPAQKIETSGNLRIYNASITIDYLNVTYEIDDDSAIITSTLFDATGGTLTDKFGNVATVTGGITHDHLKNLGFEAWLRTDRFLGLDTKKGDNPLYYGTGIGRGNIHFSGSFKQPNIYINAVTSKGSNLTMPVSYDQDGSEVTFIRFVDKKKKKEEENKSTSLADLRGLSLSMDLSITPDAEMSLIFDEQAGDIIKGRGRGNIQMFVPRVGELSMFGDFEIEEGEYLFTLMNFVNKPFNVRKGGTITWTGDPFAAQINLEAEYSGLSTSLYSFIQEYLTSASTDIQEQARVATEVDLVMLLEGDLLKPIINFDISFPRVAGRLKSYAETKLRVIKQDQNELNRQVFGLIVIGQFLPSNYNFQGSEVGINTLSEMIANQVSILVTEFISEYIGDNSIISSIDFDISYNYYENPDLNDPNNFSSGNEFQVRLKNNFLNDKLSVIAGFNSDFGNQVTPTSGALFGNDFAIEYYLNADRTLKARLYQTYQPDVIEGGNRFKFGGGVSFRREFDTFKEFTQSFFKKKKK